MPRVALAGRVLLDPVTRRDRTLPEVVEWEDEQPVSADEGFVLFGLLRFDDDAERHVVREQVAGCERGTLGVAALARDVDGVARLPAHPPPTALTLRRSSCGRAG
jgi:hypothetical protein